MVTPWEQTKAEAAIRLQALFPPQAHVEGPGGRLPLLPGQIAFEHRDYNGISATPCLVRAGETCPHGYSVVIETPRVLSPWLDNGPFQARVDRDGNEVAGRHLMEALSLARQHQDYQRLELERQHQDYQRLELERQGWTLIDAWPHA